MKSKNVLSTHQLNISSVTGRNLISDLNMNLGHEQVVVIGRNGVGKSTLIKALANGDFSQGITCTNNRWIVHQSLVDNVFNQSSIDDLRNKVSLLLEFELWQIERELSEIGLSFGIESLKSVITCLSQGELRKLNLVLAKLKEPELLFLDEPTEDLDQQGKKWLFKWLKSWNKGLIIVSHCQSLMRLFDNFFIVAESGCRYFNGNFSALENDLVRKDTYLNRKYLNKINNLNEEEQRNNKILKRRQQKKAQGRLRELGRMTPKVRLNWKRGYAQESQARVAKIRNDRIEGERLLVKAKRKQLSVSLPLQLNVSKLSLHTANNIIELNNIKLVNSKNDLSIAIRRQRVAITGDNGAGKTSLLKVIMGHKSPFSGSVRHIHSDKIAYISQGAENWLLEESLFEYLSSRHTDVSDDVIATIIATSRFPLALAGRPMKTLSHGERVRAALICILAINKTKQSIPECLILDEPTTSLDILAVYELKKLLSTWRGALLVVSHETTFLDDIAIETWINLKNGEIEIQHRG